ncbi:DNA/RNA helicase, superfamily II [Bacillus sp. AFS006103]|nr:DNA/RNA helicase, superfamily II [Bacillus sp. AFS006103]
MIAVTPKFAIGENVIVKSTGKIGTINKVIPSKNSVGYKITIDGKMITYPEKFLEGYVNQEQEILDNLVLNNFGRYEEFKIFNTWIRLKKPFEGNYYSYLGSKTIFNPFQFKPLMKFLNYQSSERLFIADEVGVGKTIETGIILTELLARGRVNRRKPVLIVCPNILGPKWQKEMKERFNLDFILHDSKSLRTALINAKNGRFADYEMFGVVSLQVLRSEEFLTLLEEFDADRQEYLWSLVIIDEAHHMRNQGTMSNRLGHLLSSLSDMMVMLSATPLNLRDSDLFHLMNILNPSLYPDPQSFEALIEPVKVINQTKNYLLQNRIEEYPTILRLLEILESILMGNIIQSHTGIQLLKERLQSNQKLMVEEVVQFERILSSLNPLENSFTRTLKKEAFKQKVVRDVVKIPVHLTEQENNFYNAVIQMSEELFLAKGGNPAALGFVTNLPRRMAASCIPAMQDYLQWSLQTNLYHGSNFKELDDEMVEENVDDVGDDSAMRTAALPTSIKKKYEYLLEVAKQLGEFDSKYEQFKQYITKLLNSVENSQVIVFSFFIRTLNYLKRCLEEDGFSVNLITGETPLVGKNKGQIGRYEIIDQFKNKEFQILLSSDVGGEGLDFQFCQAMINYDLPYNPMKVEQRIGRIDRFGQKAEKVFVASMYLAGTVDERIYELLYERIDLVHESIGMFEPILSKKLLDFQKDIISGGLTEEEIQNRSRDISLALEKSKLEFKQFEEQRSELLGDNEFRKLINGLDQKNDFLKPSDAAQLTEWFLKNNGSTYKPINEESGKLLISANLRKELETFTRLPGMEGCMAELGPLLKEQSLINVIFNGSTANDFDFYFLPPTGYWVKFILQTLEQRDDIYRAFSFQTHRSNTFLECGRYVIPLFEIEVEGFKAEHHLAMVPVNLEDGQVMDGNFIQMSRHFTNLLDENENIPEFSQEEWETWIGLGRSELEEYMNNYVENIRLENESIVSTRILSLQKGSETRRARLAQMIEDHKMRKQREISVTSKNYLLSVEARMENERRRTNEKIKTLKIKQEISFSLGLVGVMFLEVIEC